MNVEKLKKLREERGLLQKEIAIDLGVSRECYTHYENGNRTPDYQTLKKIAVFFNVSIDYLLDVAPSDENIIDMSGLSEESKQVLESQLNTLIKLEQARYSNETGKEFSPKSVRT